GGVVSLGAARVLSSRVDLYQVHSIDPISFVTVIAVLGLATFAACWFPARRASKVDPMEALRSE
ncbi:MAG TPA: hypothetical protein VLD18_11235, partial [Verrucomicrobiae bacterium]|nr:hypothetical protein [Verrucomicrobiae bacterium]